METALDILWLSSWFTLSQPKVIFKTYYYLLSCFLPDKWPLFLASNTLNFYLASGPLHFLLPLLKCSTPSPMLVSLIPFWLIQGIYLWLKLDMWIHKHFTVFNIAFWANGVRSLDSLFNRWHILSEVKTAIWDSGWKLLISCIHFMETKFIYDLSTVSSTTELSRNMQ